jgi:photosystem II stability/assembly factor-like uncharacterized protein
MGLRESKQIARILVDPVDHDVVYVAALGDLWKGGGERGVYKTTDGGLTWSKVLDGGADAGATELVMDPSNNKVIYAALYQRRRSVYGMNGGGPGSGIWKSTDAGRTWTRLTKGIPEGSLGRIGIDIFRKNPSILYARIEHEKESGVYRSDDAGASWTKASGTNPRPMYFSQIRIDPENENRIYVLGTNLHMSEDGGKTWNNNAARLIHVDFHAMWIDPNNPSHLMIGGDGGVGISHDRSKTYVWMNNLPVAPVLPRELRQRHAVHGLRRPPGQQHLVRAKRGAFQQRHRERRLVRGPGRRRIRGTDRPDRPQHHLRRVAGRLHEPDRPPHQRAPDDPARGPEGGEELSLELGHADAALAPRPEDALRGRAPALSLEDRGLSWEAISPDLTLAVDRDTMELMGIKGKDFKIAKNDGVSVYGTLFSFAESRAKAGVIWVGTDDGQVQVTRDAGATWTNVTRKIPGAPALAYVSKVEPSKFAEGTAYVTFDGHRLGDYGTYAYVTTDFGQGWKSIAGDLPKGQVVRTITEDVKNADVLYLGTETGLFLSTNRGGHWERVKGNLPTVPIYEITLHPRENDMILATHGRAIWVLDDLSPFQEFGKSQQADAFIFPVEPGVQWSLAEDRMREFEGDRRFLGANPSPGTAITWRLKAKADSARLVIKDAGGNVIREYKGDAMKNRLGAGLNTVQWDLRVEPLPTPPGGAEAGFFGPSLDGPQVIPGDYRATLVVNGKDAGATTVTVRGDPEITISDADRKARFDALTEIHALHGRLTKAVEVAKTMNDQQNGLKTALADTTKVPANIRAAVDSLKKAMEPLRTKLGLSSGEPFNFDPEVFRKNINFKLGGMKGGLMGATMQPTATQMRQLADLRGGNSCAGQRGERDGAEAPGRDENAGGCRDLPGGSQTDPVGAGAMPARDGSTKTGFVAVFP